MDVAANVLAIFLAVAMTFSAIGKLTRLQQVVDNLDKAEVPHSLYPLLAAVQITGATGLIVGIWMTWAGVAAGIGFALYFALAIGYHVRAGDAKGIGPPVFLGLVAVAAAVLRAAA